jgi:hypothetical protein
MLRKTSLLITTHSDLIHPQTPVPDKIQATQGQHNTNRLIIRFFYSTASADITFLTKSDGRWP